MDILIPLGTETGWQNNELRYCLRSIDRFATGYDRVFVVGEDPGFLAHEISTGTSFGRKADISHGLNGSSALVRLPEISSNRDARIAWKILWAFANTDIADEVAVFDDDYVLVAPMDVRALDYFQQGPLFNSATNSAATTVYRDSLRATASALMAAGKPALDYDVHFPIVYRRKDYMALAPWWERSRADGHGFVIHSVYANNLLPAPGPFMQDCKIRFFHDGVFEDQIRGRVLFSYSDGALVNGGFKTWLEKQFPDKSKWEK